MAPLNRITVLFLKVSISSLLLYILISKAGTERLIDTIKEVSPVSFISSALLYILSIFISSLRWRLLLMRAIEMKKLFSLYLIGSFFNHLLPGIIGGDAVKAYYLSRGLPRQLGELTGSEAGLSVASVFMDRYIGFISLLIIAVFAYPLGYEYFIGSYIEWILPLIIGVFFIASVFIFLLRIGRRIRFIAGFYNYIEYYRKEKGVLLKCLVLSLFLQIIIISSAFVISKGLGMDIPFYFFSIIIPIISVVSSVPVSISGLGIREASFVLLLSPLGVSHAQAITMSLTWFLSFALGSLPGLILYLRLKA